MQISLENGLSNFICDYCHNLVLQFYDYFAMVNANQDDLLRMTVTVLKEEVFALPIDCVKEQLEFEAQEMKLDVDDDDARWLEYDEPMNGSVEESLKISKSTKRTKVSGKTRSKPAKTIKISQVSLSKEELEKLNYFELNKLPQSYTCSYLCPFCPKVSLNNDTIKFKTKTQVKVHIMKNHFSNLKQKERLDKAQTESRNLYPHCDICQKAIRKSKLNHVIEDHKFIHYDIKPYKCDLCCFSAHTRDGLRRHILKHEERVKCLSCFYCNMKFLTKDLRQDHIREKHQNKIITCDLCGMKLPSKRMTKIHFREHISQRLTLECERCLGGVRFPDERILALHRKRHERQDKTKKPLSCHLCEQKFNSNVMFKRHLRYHVEGKITACHICGKSVQMSTHALIHMKEPKTYKCEKCGEEFPGQYVLTRHIKKIHNPNILSCYLCGKMIPEYYMQRHLNTCNAGELRCTHCPMTFTKESARQLHNNKFHTGFKCKRCNMIFDNRTQMDFHQRYDENHVKTKSKKKVDQKKKGNVMNK